MQKLSMDGSFSFETLCSPVLKEVQSWYPLQLSIQLSVNKEINWKVVSTAAVDHNHDRALQHKCPKRLLFVWKSLVESKLRVLIFHLEKIPGVICRPYPSALVAPMALESSKHHHPHGNTDGLDNDNDDDDDMLLCELKTASSRIDDNSPQGNENRTDTNNNLQCEFIIGMAITPVATNPPDSASATATTTPPSSILAEENFGRRIDFNPCIAQFHGALSTALSVRSDQQELTTNCRIHIQLKRNSAN